MTPQEKAREYFHEYYSIDAHKNSIVVRTENAIRDSILRVEGMLADLYKEYNDDMGGSAKDTWLIKRIEFWQSVKTEINKL